MLKSPYLLGSVLALLSSGTFAHYPTLDCQAVDQIIHCIAGYSDGSAAYDEPIQVLSYEDELLDTLITNDDGEIDLPRPEGEFYLMFDPGHEDPAEFDYAEL